MLEDFLSLVTKPARYINTEINSVHKDLSKVKTKVCLFFPDTYEVGMSHLGLRILYNILNSRDDTACERVFSPWLDYELDFANPEDHSPAWSPRAGYHISTSSALHSNMSYPTPIFWRDWIWQGYRFALQTGLMVTR